MRLLRGYLVMTVCMVVVEVAPLTPLHRAGVASPAASSQVGRTQHTADRLLQRNPGLVPMHPGATTGDLPPVHTRVRLATVPHQSGLALRIVFQAGSIPHVDTELLLNVRGAPRAQRLAATSTIRRHEDRCSMRQKADAGCEFVWSDRQPAVATLLSRDGIAEYSLLASVMSHATGDRLGHHPEGTEPQK